MANFSGPGRASDSLSGTALEAHLAIQRDQDAVAEQQLGTGEDSVPRQLGPVDFELGVIAGNRTINFILSLYLPNPDDGKVILAIMFVFEVFLEKQIHVSNLTGGSSLGKGATIDQPEEKSQEEEPEEKEAGKHTHSVKTNQYQCTYSYSYETSCSTEHFDQQEGLLQNELEAIRNFASKKFSRKNFSRK